MSYYDQNYQAFIDNTLNIDMTDLYSVFLKDMKKGSRILDLGCGPGRDLKYFKDHGFTPVGLEPSEKLASYARSYANCKVYEQGIEDFNSKDSYDGVWACASLLHLDTSSLKESFLKISTFMNKGSIFYCSFKYGEFEGERNGRFFNDQTLETLKELLPPELVISKDWITEDLRADRDESWINLILCN